MSLQRKCGWGRSTPARPLFQLVRQLVTLQGMIGILVFGLGRAYRSKRGENGPHRARRAAPLRLDQHLRT